MRNSLFTIFLSALFLFLSGTINAQESKTSPLSARFKDGTTLVFTSVTEPSNSSQQALGNLQIMGESKVVHRIFTDAERGVYFGYDVSIEPAGEQGQFKLSFLPLSTDPSDFLPVRMPRPPRSGSTGTVEQPQNNQRQRVKLTALSLPKYPDAQIVADGDTIAFDVLVNSKTGVKIIDLIKVTTSTNQSLEPLSSKIRGTGTVGENRPTRDFSIDAVKMKITSSRLVINGAPANENSGKFGIGLTGALLWFYAPQQGRFILSLAPREGYDFQKAGTIHGNKISFSAGGNLYEWTSSAPVVASQNDNWNLWVLHQPDYVPDFGNAKSDSYLFGAADGIEYLIKKK